MQRAARLIAAALALSAIWSCAGDPEEPVERRALDAGDAPEVVNLRPAAPLPRLAPEPERESSQAGGSARPPAEDREEPGDTAPSPDPPTGGGGGGGAGGGGGGGGDDGALGGGGSG